MNAGIYSMKFDGTFAATLSCMVLQMEGYVAMRKKEILHSFIGNEDLKSSMSTSFGGGHFRIGFIPIWKKGNWGSIRLTPVTAFGLRTVEL